MDFGKTKKGIQERASLAGVRPEAAGDFGKVGTNFTFTYQTEYINTHEHAKDHAHARKETKARV